MVLALLFACVATANEAEAPVPAPDAAPEVADPFTDWLAAPIPVAEGFAAPLAGEDCGEGCWRAARPGKARAIAAGVVRATWDGGLETEHLWYDDQVKRTARVRWEGVTPTAAAGAVVAKGDTLGVASEVRLSSDAGPMTTFVSGRPRLPVPQRERVLAVVSRDLDRMRIYAAGAEVGTFEVGFGQAEGDKELRGDNRTPKGVYFVVARSTGPFSGPVAEFYGGYWIKLGYPNPWDAARGVDLGLFDVDMQRTITSAFWRRGLPPQGTKLGGGIGLHAWAYEWDDAGPRGMSWGCVVMHPRDAAAIYEHLVEGVMVALI